MKRDLISMAIAELKRVHEEKLSFCYSDWGEAGSCGTVACAGGWLTLFPPFRALGLGYEDKEVLVPMYGSWTGSVALARFFGMTYQQASDTFLNLQDLKVEPVTALDVANKLQEYLDADAAQEVA